MRYSQRKCLQESSSLPRESLFLALFLQDVFHCLRDKRYSFGRLEFEEFPVIEPVEHVLDNLVFFLHEHDCFLLVEGWFSFSATFRIVDQGLLQFSSYTHVVDYKTAFLSRIDAVHSGYCLHQRVAFDWLVQIHGVKSRSIETGRKHVSDDEQLERVSCVFEVVPYSLPPKLVP